MRIKTLDIDPDAADPNGIAEAQTPAGAGSFTLDGALVVDGKWNTADNLGRLISFTSDGIDNGDTYTITGKDLTGTTVSESVTGPNATTVYSTGYFIEVSAITTSGAGTGNITIGFNDDFSTKIIPLDRYNTDPATVSVEGVSGTLDLTVQETFNDIQSTPQAINWFAVTALTNVSADTRSDISTHAVAMRLISNSYTDTAECKMVINQNA